MDVYNHYQGLLDVFTRCAKSSAFQVREPPRVSLRKLHPPDAVWYQLELVGGTLSLVTDIAAGNVNKLAEEMGVVDGELEILVYPREQILINDPWNIKRSQVEIAYLHYDLNSDKTALLFALHYDFGGEIDEPEEAHPIFHVSLTHNPMNLKGVLHQRNVDTTRMQNIPDVRLPTAHMTLPSVLLNVAADRFQPPDFNEFLRYMRESAEYPSMSNDPFRQRMKKQKNRMRCCAWYADLPRLVAT